MAAEGSERPIAGGSGGSGLTKLSEYAELDPEFLGLWSRWREGMYGRSVLDQKTRELCAVAALTVLDRPAALGNHIQDALEKGATPREVLEVILQMIVYGGAPSSIEALQTFRRVAPDVM